MPGPLSEQRRRGRRGQRNGRGRGGGEGQGRQVEPERWQGRRERRRRHGRGRGRVESCGARGGGGLRATEHATLLVSSLNVQSVTESETTELSNELHRFNYDTKTVQETWLKPSTHN